VSKQGKRPRASRRKGERELRKTLRERERLAELAPGSSPERAIAVTTPAVVEGRAQSTPCPLCGGQLDLEDHSAELRGEVSLRALHCRCRSCHTPRTIWFKLEPAVLN
jgi:hypothetical protein